MAGLNDKYFLADDSVEPKENPVVTIKAFKDGEEGEESPELRNDIDLIAVATEELSITLRSIELFRERADAQGGMSQSLALESLDFIPGLINDDQPAGFYTNFPSRTLYKAALEEATIEEKSVIKKFIDFLVQMYKRVSDWLKGLFSKKEVTDLTSPETVKVLTSTKEGINKFKEAANSDVAAEEVKKTYAEKVSKATQSATSDSSVPAEYTAKVKKLEEFIKNIKAKSVAAGSSARELNVMLSRLPVIRKFIVNEKEVNHVLFTHDTLTKDINGLVNEINGCIKNQDYPGLKSILNGEQFKTIKQSAHDHSLAVIEFKQLPSEYTATNVDRAMDAFYEESFLQFLAFGGEMASSGIRECQATVKVMDDIQMSIAQMASYKWSDRDGQAKEFLEELKNFNKSIITPAVQNITYSLSITTQLVNFAREVWVIDAKIAKNIQANVAKMIADEAKALGFTDEQIKQFV